jgi:Na+/melibiose symporter-like transporter
MFLFGKEHTFLIMVFLFIDTVLAQSCFSLYDLALSDIADEDKDKHNRRKPITSMIFGTNALITKPAQSLAPMGVMAILNSNGYQQFLNVSKLSDINSTSNMGLAPQLTNQLSTTMFHLICFIPVFIGIFQLITWSRYRIRFSHLRHKEEIPVSDQDISLIGTSSS